MLLATLDLKPGDFLIDPAFTYQLLNGVTKQAGAAIDTVLLTKQEQRIVTLQQDGFSLQEIADKLSIEISTVRRHLATVSAKRKQRDEQK